MTNKKSRKRKRRKKQTNKKTRKKTRKWLQEKCAPKKRGEMLKFTCYTSRGLHKIKNIWNKKHPDRRILSNDPRNIWNSLYQALSKSCNKESCWLKHKCINENIDLDVKKYSFAPKAPEEWKNTTY